MNDFLRTEETIGIGKGMGMFSIGHVFWILLFFIALFLIKHHRSKQKGLSSVIAILIAADEIIKHVSDGLALADRYKLPEEIKQFIVTHHGTTCTAYFYNKYLNAGGDPDKADDFYYKGVKPKTPEQVIVMLCDTLEAASRTLKDYTPESISELVENVVKSKMAAGQFEDADITLKDLNTIKGVLKDYIQQMHHARVVYPKRNLPDQRPGHNA